jgi:hypothetical protein
MNMKKIVFALAGVVMSCALLAGNSLAADSWAVCTPSQVGPSGTSVFIQLTGCNIDPSAGMSGYMTLSTEGSDQMMAVVLTAISLAKPVAVSWDGTKSAEGYNIAKALILSK